MGQASKFFTFSMLALVCVFLPACFSTPAEDSSTDSKTATKSANITISDTALQSDSRNAITTEETGDYLLSAQAIDTTSNVVVTLYNSGDVPAEKIKGYSLDSPLAYAGGSYPGTGGTCTQKIFSQTSCTIVLSFAPTVMGTNSSKLRLGYYNGKITRLFEKVFKATGYSVPTITSITQNVGSASGGNMISILGTQIFTGAYITLDGQICSASSSLPPTGITCVVPNHTLGAVDVVLTNTDGKTYTVPSGYTYVPPPSVSAISPSAGALAGGTSVTITGSNFLSGASVTIGGTVCSSVSVASALSLTCTTGAHAATTADVVVTNRDMQAATLSSAYTYQAAPTVSSVSPSTGLLGGGEYLTITGSGFLSGATVTIGGVTCASPVINTSTSITCVAPAATPGSAVNIVVTNSDNQSGTGSALYTYTTGEAWTSITTTNIPLSFVRSVYVWTGSKVFIWNESGPYNTGVLYDPVTNNSTLTSTTNAPAARNASTGVWTGSKILVWSGSYATYMNTGGAYDPSSNTWTPMTTTGAPAGREKSFALWTGSKMIVWGGSNCASNTCNQGGIYDPTLNSWSLMSTTNAPATVSWPRAVWTGTQFLTSQAKYNPTTDVWTANSTTNIAAIGDSAFWLGDKMLTMGSALRFYTPATDVWTLGATTGAPTSGASEFYNVWTGSLLICWRGSSGSSRLYNLRTDSWSAMTTVNQPPDRQESVDAFKGSTIWTGKQMFVWGGQTAISSGITVNTGGLYTPPVDSASNSWTATTTTGAPSPRTHHVNLWTGSKILVWGGEIGGGGYIYNDGAAYDPVTNSWITMSTVGAPAQRWGAVGAWTGSKMLVWGGIGFSGGSIMYNTGAIYDPATNTWSAMSTPVSLPPRLYHSGTWTGSKFVVWGGYDQSTLALNDGGIYDPSADSWSYTSTVTAAAKRYQHSAIWIGSKMIVWGGKQITGAAINTGSVYDPNSDTWSSVTTTNAPGIRLLHAALWTGSKMLVWGGTQNVVHNSGGLYDPSTNSWSTTSTLYAPSPRHSFGYAWINNKMVVFGGSTDTTTSTFINDGGMYDPSTNVWVSMSSINAPSARSTFNFIPIGSRIFQWGGYAGAYSIYYNTGGLYTP